jgi:hypothetical protein
LLQLPAAQVQVVEELVELNPKRITSLGISLAGGDQLQKEVGPPAPAAGARQGWPASGPLRC